MKIYTNINELPNFKQSVLTIGSFDGLHHGHRKILERVKMKARENDLESIVVTFSPHPRLVLFPGDKDFKLLNVGNERIRHFQDCGIDHLVFYPFSFEFSRYSPGEYIEKFLVKLFNPAYIIIGYDHRFGLNRMGDIYLLKKMASKYSYRIIEIKKQEIEETAISSTRIRQAIATGDLESAQMLSGHNYFLLGKVVNGYKYGRQIGFPTANLKVDEHKLLPADGVYAVKIHLEGNTFSGMMYIGKKPSFEKHKSRVLEVHIFDFSFDIYGSEIEVEFIQLIRTSQKFDSLESLHQQLLKDRKHTQEILSNLPLKEDSKPRIAVVILNYNGKEYLEEFMPSVVEAASNDIKFIIADNGSSDDSISFIQNYYPEVQIHEMERNYGFAEGYNRVIRSINGYEYIVFLNSDVETEKGWLDDIIELMDKDKRIGIAQPKILSYEEKEKFEYAGAAGGLIDVLAYPFCRGRIFNTIEEDNGQYDDNKEVFWTSGAAMVMRKDLFDKIGGFDSSFFAHQEEIDLCWRVKKAGYKVMAIGSSKVYHLGGGTLSYVNPKKHFLNFRNNLLMLLKNDSTFNIIWKFPVRLILDGIAGLKFLLEGQSKSTAAIIKAHFDVYKKLPVIIQKRKKIKKDIERLSIGSPRVSGRYNGMIIWDYFIRKKEKYAKLKDV